MTAKKEAVNSSGSSVKANGKKETKKEKNHLPVK